MNSMAMAVKVAVARGQVDHEWRGSALIGRELADAHILNECFSLSANEPARADFYCMWSKERAKS